MRGCAAPTLRITPKHVKTPPGSLFRMDVHVRESRKSTLTGTTGILSYSGMDQISIVADASLSAADRAQIIRGLVSYNDTRAALEDYQELLITARQNGELVGGLLGHTHWRWLFVSHLWIAEGSRRSGLGTSLLRAAEAEACARGCLHAHCDTFDFQALPFYQRLGYHIFGCLDDYPTGHSRCFLQKRDLHVRGIPRELGTRTG